MIINNKLITLSLIIYRTFSDSSESDSESESSSYNGYYTSKSFEIWNHKTETCKTIELQGLQGENMLNLSGLERENLWLSLLNKELIKELNETIESNSSTSNSNQSINKGSIIKLPIKLKYINFYNNHYSYMPNF